MRGRKSNKFFSELNNKENSAGQSSLKCGSVTDLPSITSTSPDIIKFLVSFLTDKELCVFAVSNSKLYNVLLFKLVERFQNSKPPPRMRPPLVLQVIRDVTIDTPEVKALIEADYLKEESIPAGSSRIVRVISVLGIFILGYTMFNNSNCPPYSVETECPNNHNLTKAFVLSISAFLLLALLIQYVVEKHDTSNDQNFFKRKYRRQQSWQYISSRQQKQKLTSSDTQGLDLGPGASLRSSK